MHTTGQPLLRWPWIVTLLMVMVGLDLAVPSLLHGAVAADVGPGHLQWTSIGLATGLLAVSPRARWPVLLVLVSGVSAVTSLARGVDTREVTWLAITGAAQVVVTVAIIRGRRLTGARLESLPDLVRVVVAALASGLLAAVSESWIGGSRDEPALTAGLLLASHVTSVLVLSSLVLAGGLFRPRTASWEPALQVASFVAVVAAVFAPDQQLPLTFLPILVLVWAALRFDSGVLVWELAALLVIIPLLSARDLGPFEEAVRVSSLEPSVVGALSYAFVLFAALITLPLALTSAQGRELTVRATQDERRFRRHFDGSPLGMILLHHDGTRLVVDTVNDAAVDVLAGARDDLVGRDVDTLIHTHEPLGRVMAQLLSGRTDSWRGGAEVRSRPGSRIDLVLTALEIRPDELILSAQLLDITQEVHARRNLDAAHKLTDATLDTTACIIVVTDSSGTVVRVNSSSKDITGYDAVQLLGLPIWDTPIAPLDQAETEALFLWPNRSGASSVRERTGRTGDGRTLHVVWSNNVVRDELGMPAYAVLTGIDVTAERQSASLVTHLMQASVATALIGIDSTGRVTVFSSGARHLLGFEEDDVVGTPFVDLLDPVELGSRTAPGRADGAFARLVEQLDPRHELTAQDWTWRTKDGHEVVVSMTISATDDTGDADDFSGDESDAGDADEPGVGYLCVGRDVTERRAAQAALVEALQRERTAGDRLRALDQAKDEFVTTVSHELRTPVTSIMGYTEMLSDGSVVEAHAAQVSMLASIARNGERLMVICNDLLLLGGFESGHTHESFEDIDLRTTMATAEDSTEAMLKDRAVTVTFDRSEEPLLVHGDRTQLGRVVVNLLSNAIKFTEDGGSVLVRVVAEGHDAVLTVTDTGMGIATEDREAVFQRFFRTTSAHTGAIPGTGLGLPIVAGIVEDHAGSIALDSEPGTGTVFTVRLPRVWPGAAVATEDLRISGLGSPR